jgi:integrase
MVSRKRGNGSIFQPPGTSRWTIQYYVSGRRIREKTGSSDYREAQQILQQKLADRNKGLAPAVLRKVKVQELHEGLMRSYRNNQRKSRVHVDRQWEHHLASFFGNQLANQVTTDTIERYVDSRLKEGAAHASVNRELAALKTMFRIAARNGTVARLPLFPVLLRENNARRGFIEDDAFAKLTAHADQLWLRLFLEMAYTFGWRKSELLQLRVGHVDLANRLVRLDTSKNGEGREVAMTTRVFHMLEQAVTGKQPDDFVFTRDNGTRVKDCKRPWQRLRKKAGLPGLLLHDFRRSAARNLRRAGVAESVVMSVGGWKTAAMFRRYAIVSNADQRQAMEKLEQQQAENSRNFSRNLPLSANSQPAIKVEKVN